MPLRNRVTPYGEIVAIPERGTLMGNRGLLHADDGEHKRDWKVLRWIACELEFRGRRRPLRQPGQYTELFFLDEATALAAGHRPCGECRRADFKRWQAGWPHGDTKVDAMDRVLHDSRLDGEVKRTYEATLGELPDGVIVERAGAPFLWAGGALRAWSPAGYGAPGTVSVDERVTVLTPAATVAVIENGYAVSTHPSAS